MEKGEKQLDSKAALEVKAIAPGAELDVCQEEEQEIKREVFKVVQCIPVVPVTGSG